MFVLQWTVPTLRPITIPPSHSYGVIHFVWSVASIHFIYPIAVKTAYKKHMETNGIG